MIKTELSMKFKGVLRVGEKTAPWRNAGRRSVMCNELESVPTASVSGSGGAGVSHGPRLPNLDGGKYNQAAEGGKEVTVVQRLFHCI